MANVKKKVNLNRVFVIIPAAGLGTRMESTTNKQFIEVDGISVIERTLNAFQTFANELAAAGTTLRAVVVTSDDYVFKVNGIIRYRKYNYVQSVVSGGDTRTESVWKGIEALADLPFPPNDNDIVFIHDGARCLIDEATLERCLEGAIQYDIVAAAVPVKSTIKQVEPPVKPEPKVEETTAPAEEPKKSSALGLDLSKFPALSKRLGVTKEEPKVETPAPAPAPAPVVKKEEAKPVIPEIKNKPIFKSAVPVSAPEVTKTPARDELMEVQTPQAFRFDKLLKSYVNGIRRGIKATDDTSLAEALNYKVHLVEGSYSNIKITTPEDISYAEAILKRMAEGQTES